MASASVTLPEPYVRETLMSAARGQRRPGCPLWALVVSNHRPPPCKGEARVLVMGLIRTNRVPLSAVKSV
jgi:hypothetical protein